MKVIDLFKSKKFVIIVILLIVSAIFSTLASYLSGKMIQFAVDKDFSNFIKLTIFVISCYCIGNGLAYFRAIIKEKYLQQFVTSLREFAIFEFKDEFINSDNKNNGAKYINMATSDVQYAESYSNEVFAMIGYIIQVIVATIFLLQFHISVIAIILVLLLLMIVVPKFFEKKLATNTEDISRASEIFNKNLENYVNSATTLKNSNSLSLLDKVVKVGSLEIADGKINRTKSATRLNVIIVTFNAINQILLLAFSGYLAYKGVIEFGMIFAIASLAGVFFSNVLQALSVYPSYAYLKAILKKYNTSVQNKEENIVDNIHFKNNITLKNVSYSYEEKQLNFPNITIEKNKKYIIVGESGSGKSTLLNIFNGNFKNYSGEIYWDNTDFKKFTFSQIKNSIATMSQKNEILNGTIKDNIVLNKDFDEDRFKNVLEKARLEKVVDKLPDRENSELDSMNTSLSGGQLQRISLARTLYQNSQIIIIDEGTANLDKNTAEEIENLLFKDENLTVIMVTHHLNSNVASLADEIIEI